MGFRCHLIRLEDTLGPGTLKGVWPAPRAKADGNRGWWEQRLLGKRKTSGSVWAPVARGLESPFIGGSSALSIVSLICNLIS